MLNKFLAKVVRWLLSSPTLLFSNLLVSICFLNAQAANDLEISGATGLSATANEFYALTGETGAVYRSVDGAAWVKLGLNASNINTYFSSVSFDASGVYLASSDGLLRSQDSGKNWSTLPTKEQIFFMLPLAEKNTILARTWKTGLLRSENGGITWYNVGAELGNYPVLSMLQDNHGTVWAATFGGGIYRSSDNGVTWKSAGLEQSYLIKLAIHADTLYAGTYRNGIYRYHADSWLPINDGLPENATVEQLASTPEGLAASVNQHELYLLNARDANWQLIENNLFPIKKITGIAALKGGDWLIATIPRGLLRVNPENQLWLSVPLEVTVQSVVSNHQDLAYALLPNDKILHGKLTDAAAWEYFATLPNLSKILFTTRTGALLAAGKTGLHWKNPEENSWQQINLPLSNVEITCITEIDDQIIIGTNDRGVLRSTTMGKTWDFLPKNHAINTCAAAGNYLYAINDMELSVSNDAGTTWRDYSLATPPLALVADNERGVIIIPKEISQKNRLKLWQSIDGNTPHPFYLEINGKIAADSPILTVANDTLYLASANGVELFKRDNNDWQWQGQVLSQVNVNNFAQLADGQVIAATNHGLFILNGVDEAAQIPIAY